MSQKYDEPIALKILIVGKLACGKTSIIQRLCHHEFQAKYKPTIGVDFHTKDLEVMGTNTLCQLWDIAGQERFGHMTRVYFQHADGALVVFDATRSATFYGAKEWKDDIDDCFPKEKLPTVLLANKSDLIPASQQQQFPEDIDNFCEQNGFLGWYNTSAKEGTGITEALTALVTQILQNNKDLEKTEQKDAFKLRGDNNDSNTQNGEERKCSC